MTRVAQAFVELRKLRGWSIRTLARAVQRSETEIRDVEAGKGSLATLVDLGELFGVDLGALRGGSRRPSVRASLHSRPSSIFLFHTEQAVFHPADLAVFGEALGFARGWAARPEAQEGLRVRLSHEPVPVIGKHRAEAAKQGEQLARSLRASWCLPTEPIGDLRQHIEERLGAVVVVRALSSGGVRAGAVLDADRAGAAIVLRDMSRSSARTLVDLAHETCHLVFDPAPATAVQLALDGGEASSESALRECRARGFAAELLLPHAGLIELFGAPDPATAEPEAMVQRASRHFGTTWEIAANHLHNLGFLSRVAWEQVRFLKSKPVGSVLTLPKPAGPPLCMPEHGADSDSESAAEQAWSVARSVSTALVQDADLRAHIHVQRAITSATGGSPMRAVAELGLVVLRAAQTGDVLLATAVLRSSDLRNLPAEELLGLLGNVGASRGLLGDCYEQLCSWTLGELRAQGWTAEQVQEAQALLR